MPPETTTAPDLDLREFQSFVMRCLSQLMSGVSLRLERSDDRGRRIAMRVAWAVSVLLNETHIKARKVERQKQKALGKESAIGDEGDQDENLPGVLDFGSSKGDDDDEEQVYACVCVCFDKSFPTGLIKCNQTGSQVIPNDKQLKDVVADIKFWSGLPLRECFCSNSDPVSRLSPDPSQPTGLIDSIEKSKLPAEEKGDMDTLIFDESTCQIRWVFFTKNIKDHNISLSPFIAEIPFVLLLFL